MFNLRQIISSIADAGKQLFNKKDIAKLFATAVDTKQDQRNKMAINGYNYYINNFTKNKIVDRFLSSI